MKNSKFVKILTVFIVMFTNIMMSNNVVYACFNATESKKPLQKGDLFIYILIIILIIIAIMIIAIIINIIFIQNKLLKKENNTENAESNIRSNPKKDSLLIKLEILLTILLIGSIIVGIYYDKSIHNNHNNPISDAEINEQVISGRLILTGC